MPKALQDTRRSVELATALNYPYLEASARLGLTQVLLEMDDVRATEEQLAAVEILLDRSASESLRLSLLLSRAESVARSAGPEHSLALLREAMAFGAASDSRFVQMMSRANLIRLCARALANVIEPAYVRTIIRSWSLTPPTGRVAQWPWPLKITTLGGFQLFKDGEPLALSRKTPRRLFKLLKALVAFGGKDVAVDRIVDAVWPDEDGDFARKNFDVAIHRLRKLIGDNDSIVVKGGVVGFDPALLARCLGVRGWPFREGRNARGDWQDPVAVCWRLSRRRQ